MKKPKVTVVCPIHPDRKDELENLYEQYKKQDYKRLDGLIVGDGGGTIGFKRNELVKMAKGDIICFMDSDDDFASDWVSRGVDFLLSNPTVMITGLSSAYFKDINTGQRYLWDYQGSKKHVAEGTMIFWRKIHSDTKCFGNTSRGEGLQFLQGNGKILPHTYIDGFTANITGRNTESHIAVLGMRKIL